MKKWGILVLLIFIVIVGCEGCPVKLVEKEDGSGWRIPHNSKLPSSALGHPPVFRTGTPKRVSYF